LAKQAESNRTAVVPIVPHRGWILDRNGVVLANNYSAYTLEVTPSEVEFDTLDELIAELGKIVRIEARDIKRFKKLQAESKNFEPLPLRARLSEEEVARFTAQRYRFAGVDVQARLFRSYPLDETAAHVVGYIGRINQHEKDELADASPEIQANYKGTDYIGKLGIEQSYEELLHGTTGVEQMETSAGGRALRLLGSIAPKPGGNVVLSIDIKLQKLVEDMFGDRRGALVAIDPSNGEILAFVSKPTFDPNLFVDGIDVDNWRALNESINRPLLNRALKGVYPPGSTYKPFMALAALEMGLRKPQSITNDPGYWMFGNHRFRSHGAGLGAVNMRRSIVVSSNVYYYALANDMGVERMHDFMAPLGFGQKTGIDLDGEATGLLPNQAWKRKRFAQAKNPRQGDWVAGETISLGIGQGYNNFTMLQLAHALATVVNGGNSYRPHVGMATQDMATGQRTPIAQPAAVHLGYKPEHIAVIKDAMVGVAKEGTGRGSFASAKYISGGKTGTAQAVTIGQKDHYNAAKLEEHQRDHALYEAFAPVENPKIAVAVIVENAGFGASSAAPIARRVLDYWLLGLYPSEQDLALVRYGKASAPVGTPRLAAQVPLVPDQKTLVLSDSGVLSERDIPPMPPAIAALPDAQLDAAQEDEDDAPSDSAAKPSPIPSRPTQAPAPISTPKPTPTPQALTPSPKSALNSAKKSGKNPAPRP
jgi:penicillin-binding protein 2